MHKSKIAALVAGTALAALTAGCGGDASHNNTNTTNNSNVAVVTNANANTNRQVNVNTNSNANGNWNANISREDYEKNKDYYSGEAKRMGSKVGSGANDAWLWTKVRAALLSADDLRDSTVEVDVENGAVTLKGTVANGAQKIRAVDVAKKIEGVTKVTNNIQVRADGGAGSNNNNANRQG